LKKQKVDKYHIN